MWPKPAAQASDPRELGAMTVSVHIQHTVLCLGACSVLCMAYDVTFWIKIRGQLEYVATRRDKMLSRINEHSLRTILVLKCI